VHFFTESSDPQAIPPAGTELDPATGDKP